MFIYFLILFSLEENSKHTIFEILFTTSIFHQSTQINVDVDERRPSISPPWYFVHAMMLGLNVETSYMNYSNSVFLNHLTDKINIIAKNLLYFFLADYTVFIVTILSIFVS